MAHGAMVGDGMVFGMIVSEVAVAFVPVVFELSLGFAVLEPEEAHVDGFGSTLLDGTVGDADGGTVVASDV